MRPRGRPGQSSIFFNFFSFLKVFVFFLKKLKYKMCDNFDKNRDVVESDDARPIRVCVLFSSYEGSESELKGCDDFEKSPATYLQGCPRFSFASVAIKKATAFSQIQSLVKGRKFDVFFNLCHGSRDDVAGVDVVHALEHFEAAFTGSDSKHYEQTKLEMKMLAYYAGISVPAFAHISSKEQIVTSCAKLKFPVIVKQVAGYSSMGMTKASKCNTMQDLVAVASVFLDRFYEALVEEFIEGIEVSVLACENPNTNASQSFCPVQIHFPPGESFKHFDLKWNDYEAMSPSVVLDSDLDGKCRRVGQLAFEKILGGIGYGRSDLRIDAEGNVYLLEINANCQIFYPPGAHGTADIILANDPLNASGFATLMIEAALARCRAIEARKPPAKIAFAPGERRASLAFPRWRPTAIVTRFVARGGARQSSAITSLRPAISARASACCARRGGPSACSRSSTWSGAGLKTTGGSSRSTPGLYPLTSGLPGQLTPPTGAPSFTRAGPTSGWVRSTPWTRTRGSISRPESRSPSTTPPSVPSRRLLAAAVWRHAAGPSASTTTVAIRRCANGTGLGSRGSCSSPPGDARTNEDSRAGPGGSILAARSYRHLTIVPQGLVVVFFLQGPRGACRGARADPCLS